MGKAQTMVVSSIVLVVLIIFILSLFVSFYGNLFGSEDAFKELESEASNVGMLLASKPYPVNWNKDTIKKVGLVKDDAVEGEQLLRYGNLGYAKTKMLLGIKKDYLFFITNSKDNDPFKVGKYEYWGWPGNESSNGASHLDEALVFINTYSENLVKDERFVILEEGGKKTDAKIVVYMWDFAEGDIPLFEPSPEEYENLFSAYLQTTQQSYSAGEEVRLTR